MSAEPSSAQSTSADTTEIFEQLKDYKWDEDSDFKVRTSKIHWCIYSLGTITLILTSAQ
jgi:hypothetical protein